jgi:hypothetical protein
MSGICKDCRWWDQKQRIFVDAASEGVCLLTISAHGFAQDSCSKAVAKDYEQYGAVLVTDAYFGCVQWSAKEAR